MRILLTNDDGIESPSLKFLAERLRKKHEIWIIAPDAEKSGSSHSITIKKWLKYTKIDKMVYKCSGTPVDCIILGILHLIKNKIDMVISGPNIGANLGTDIIYSGTAAAARQAALMGIPALASSLYNEEMNSTATRLCQMWCDGLNGMAATALRLVMFVGRFPRVARASQPWALRRNPVGIG